MSAIDDLVAWARAHSESAGDDEMIARAEDALDTKSSLVRLLGDALDASEAARKEAEGMAKTALAEAVLRAQRAGEAEGRLAATGECACRLGELADDAITMLEECGIEPAASMLRARLTAPQEQTPAEPVSDGYKLPLAPEQTPTLANVMGATGTDVRDDALAYLARIDPQEQTPETPFNPLVDHHPDEDSEYGWRRSPAPEASREWNASCDGCGYLHLRVTGSSFRCRCGAVCCPATPTPEVDRG